VREDIEERRRGNCSLVEKAAIPRGLDYQAEVRTKPLPAMI